MLNVDEIIKNNENKFNKNGSSGVRPSFNFNPKLPNTLQTILLNILFIVILVGGYVLKPVPINLMSPDIYMFIGIMIIILSAINFHFFVKKVKSAIIVIVTLLSIVCATALVLTVISWPIWDNGNQYKNQIGKIEKLSISDSKKFEFNLQKNYVVNKTMAMKIADKKMGVGSLSSQYSMGDATLQKISYNGENRLFWVINLEYNSFWTQFTNQSIKNIILVDANRPQDSAILLSKNAKNKSLNIKISKNAVFEQNLNRIMQLRNPFSMLTDYSFELDDELNPHYIATKYTNSRGFGLRKVIGVVDMDVQTGQMKQYSLNKVPNWIDRVNPISLVQEQIENSGEFIHGIFNFSNKDKYQLSDENENFVYLENEPFFISGLTSQNSDSSLIGIIAKSLRENKTYIVKIDGAIESSAMKSAEGKVQNYNYKAISPIIVFTNNRWKYLVPLVDNENLIKSFALVDIQNYQNVELFDDVEQFVNEQKVESVDSKNTANLDKKSSIDIIKEKINTIQSALDGLNKELKNIK